MQIEEKCRILEGICGCVPENGAGEDEENLLPNFLPLRSYSKLADPKIFLITGGRGSGKTELFRILTSCGGLDYVISDIDRKRYTRLRESEFLIGYIAKGQGSKSFPIANVCDELLEKENPENLTSFWGGLICAVLLKHFQNDQEITALTEQYLGIETKNILMEYSSEVSKWWKALDTNKEKWESFLDHTDTMLEKRDIHICIVYDELDHICSKYEDLFGFIRSLLDFWYRHNSRFSNIKAKIFLRSDLYKAKALQFVDASKMGAYRLELNWDVRSLYRLLVKRMANTGIEELESYLESVPGLMHPGKNEALGYVPEDSEDAFRRLIDKMIGPYMGKNAKKGVSYAWVPNHIQDANGEMAPRAFLKCFSFAAEEMLNSTGDVAALEKERVLLPTRLQGVVVKVSADRVQELTQEEYQWLQNLIDRLDKKTMLMQQEEFLGYLNPENWPEAERGRLPGKTAIEIMEVLMTLGIVMKTADERVNIPEIYLHGFGLKRKGGIKRPK